MSDNAEINGINNVYGIFVKKDEFKQNQKTKSNMHVIQKIKHKQR